MEKEQAIKIAEILEAQKIFGDANIKVLIYVPNTAGEYIDMQTGAEFQLMLKHK